MQRSSVRADAERAVILSAQLRGAHVAFCTTAIFFRAAAERLVVELQDQAISISQRDEDSIADVLITSSAAKNPVSHSHKKIKRSSSPPFTLAHLALCAAAIFLRAAVRAVRLRLMRKTRLCSLRGFYGRSIIMDIGPKNPVSLVPYFSAALTLAHLALFAAAIFLRAATERVRFPRMGTSLHAAKTWGKRLRG
jgi:hypothetical protein